MKYKITFKIGNHHHGVHFYNVHIDNRYLLILVYYSDKNTFGISKFGHIRKYSVNKHSREVITDHIKE